MAKKNTKKKKAGSPPEQRDRPDYRLKKGEAEKLERWLFWVTEDGEQKKPVAGLVPVRSVTLDETCLKLTVSRRPEDNNIPPAYLEKESIPLELVLGLELISDRKDAKIERELVMKEYLEAQEVGRHIDLLRWNVSKFFLSIQTVFVVVAGKGLIELSESSSQTKTAIGVGLAFLAPINILLCFIWWQRNTGIHGWHRAEIVRQQMIELDPRLRQTIAFYSTVCRRKKGPHTTGDLECWGPPAVFIALWIGISFLALHVWLGIGKLLSMIWEALTGLCGQSF